LEEKIDLFLHALFEQRTKNVEKLKEKDAFLRQKEERIFQQTNHFFKERIKEAEQTYSRKKQ
jgi:alpha/beta superfamily hydrolase